MTKDELRKWNTPITRGDMKVVLGHISELLVDMTEVMAALYKDEDDLTTVRRFKHAFENQKLFLDFVKNFVEEIDNEKR